LLTYASLADVSVMAGRAYSLARLASLLRVSPHVGDSRDVSRAAGVLVCVPSRRETGFAVARTLVAS
jgi:hypothetical protein